MAIKTCRHVANECEHKKYRGWFTNDGLIGVGSGPTYQCVSHDVYTEIKCEWPDTVTLPCTYDCGHPHTWERITSYGTFVREECRVCHVWKDHLETREQLKKIKLDCNLMREKLAVAFTPEWKKIVDAAWTLKKEREDQEEDDRGCPCCR